MPDINRNLIRRGRTFRVFVSSTFSDMKAERNALHRHVFPELERRCLQHGCRFQAIDLRWGISDEATLDQQTMNICLGELRQQVSPKPKFILLLGNGSRYHRRSTRWSSVRLCLDEANPSVKQGAGNGWYRRSGNA